MQEGQLPDPTPTEAKPRSRYQYRSLFWAIVVIGAGVIWLLFNLDVVSVSNLGMLSFVWPILLIGIGVDMLVGRRSLGLGALVGVVTVGLIIALMFVGAHLGWAGDTGLKTQTFETPVGQATAVNVTLELKDYPANIHALPSSTATDRPLLAATANYRGSISFETSGDTEKTVSLKSKSRWWFQFLESDRLTPWEIGLDPTVPLSLRIATWSDAGRLDLSGLNLTDLEVDASSGSTQLTLPAIAERGYKAALDLSSGEMKVQAAAGARIDMSVDMSSGDVEATLGAGSDVTLRFDGSSGDFTLILAADQALRVEVRDVSSGDIELPSGMVQVAEGEDGEGTWETQGYADAAHKVNLIIDNMSSGDVTIRLGS